MPSMSKTSGMLLYRAQILAFSEVVASVPPYPAWRLFPVIMLHCTWVVGQHVPLVSVEWTKLPADRARRKLSCGAQAEAIRRWQRPFKDDVRKHQEYKHMQLLPANLQTADLQRYAKRLTRSVCTLEMNVGM